MTTPSNEDQITRLIEAGIAPAEAKRIVGEVDQRDGRLLGDAQLAVMADATSQDVATFRNWWYHNPAVPNWAVRLLDAKRRK